MPQGSRVAFELIDCLTRDLNGQHLLIDRFAIMICDGHDKVCGSVLLPWKGTV
jgi:hypothetical protein